ncbi:MAG: hypothetical protein ACRDSL_07690 [Pseudonocardiaceae bacterium]
MHTLGAGALNADNPDVAKAVRLLHHIRLRGFVFDFDSTEAGGPLVGTRTSEEWIDTIHLEGFTRDCLAWRQRRRGDAGQVEHRVQGDACTVLTEALSWEATLLHIEGDVAHVLRW